MYDDTQYKIQEKNSDLVSIVTVSYNAEVNIGHAIESINYQTHASIEHVIVDGMSSDSTVAVVKTESQRPYILIQEPDDGIYDALNKALTHVTGSIVLILHADDILFDENVVTDIVKFFQRNPSIDFCYANVIHKKFHQKNRIHRAFKAGEFTRKKLNHGWMPPHPGVILRSGTLKKAAPYNTAYEISADYDYIIRLFRNNELKSAYFNINTHVMFTGGKSQASVANRFKKFREDLQIARTYFANPWITVTLKMIRKLPQFWT